eukprot:CAMPEP_0185486172 /NCGR_PEP_ID=MMETSP1366-20130426/10649_1 /TAXON_ID=38817 /ORGANISM="Gephyrocapsa oceanica, Strain RCC1303" /LENGTH=57 /DNA_ID=CAMNT_0028094395 /DNA_START=65 /DNA_END=234 /DNA_ORIENTATION=-
MQHTSLRAARGPPVLPRPTQQTGDGDEGGCCSMSKGRDCCYYCIAIGRPGGLGGVNT